MTLNYDHILVLDLETTGTDEEQDQILEIGGILIDTNLDEIARMVTTVAYPASMIPTLPTVVQEMHEVNGLWGALLVPTDPGVYEADVRWCEWLRQWTGSTKHVALAGSGVGHFDRRFIKAQMPSFDRKLTYWPFDVGCIRRTATDLAGVYPGRLPAQDSKTHRALEDADFHLNELRFWTRHLKYSFEEPF